MSRAHGRLVESIAEWWQPLDALPRTLIHNDFSPRNMALRQDGAGLRLCAYDWELAAFGPPQRDLAEFLCFVLPPNVDLGDRGTSRRSARRSLEAATGQSISEELWRLGFAAALADLLIDKLAFYVMVHRVRPQRFLPRVMRSWRRLYDIFSPGPRSMSAPMDDFHASNLLTYVGLAAALAAVAMAVERGSFAGAGALIAVAALADTFDGRFARRFPRTERQRQVGAQLDSLVDAIVFGLAPIVVASALPGRSGGMAGAAWWAAAFCYVLRDGDEAELLHRRAGRLAVRRCSHAGRCVDLVHLPALAHRVVGRAVRLVACAVAMVAPVEIPRPRGAALACFALWAVSLVALHGVHLLR